MAGPDCAFRAKGSLAPNGAECFYVADAIAPAVSSEMRKESWRAGSRILHSGPAPAAQEQAEGEDDSINVRPKWLPVLREFRRPG
jgi:hypothetical protein